MQDIRAEEKEGAMKAVVTGGAGFIGCNLVRALVRQHGIAVTAVDDLYTGSLQNLEDVISDIEFVHGSVLDTELLEKTITGADLVFHLAARNIIASSQDPLADLEVNAKGTLNVLRACLNSNVKKVVYASTSSIYGNPRYLPVAEDEPPMLLNFYSVSKFAGEGYCNVFFELYDLPVVVVRYSNVYGYYQSPDNPYCGVIGKFIAWALKGEPLIIHGDGEQTRDFTFVEDAVKATIAAALSPRTTGKIYNIGTGREISINQLARMILKATHSQSEILHVEKRDIDNVRRRVLNIERLRRDLKFLPRYTLEEGIRKTVEWFRAMQIASHADPT